MAYSDPKIHPLYIRTIRTPLSSETQSQLARYCYRFEQEEIRVYGGAGLELEYKVRLYGLRENCRVLVHMLVESHV